jgi:hypothetical protein
MPTRIDYSSNATIQPVNSSGSLGAVSNSQQSGPTAAVNSQINPTKTFQAQVVSLLSDGSALVKILNNPPPSSANSDIQLRLPPGFQIGDQLQLTITTKEGALPSYIVNTPNQSNIVKLSNTALLLEQLLNTTTTPSQITSTTPLLLSNSSLDPAKLAAQLQQTVDKSGLFYISHLQQWLNGQRTLEQIRQEPQNLSSEQKTATDQTATANNLIPAQLNTQENRQFVWQGELLPGQSLQWEIIDDSNKQQQSSTAQTTPEKVWQSNVRFQLPNLGQINATIQLQGDHASLRINTLDPAIAQALKLHSQQLAESLAVSGTTLDTLMVNSDAET